MRKRMNFMAGFMLFCLLFMGNISVVFAANVVVRAGEHEKYSRLVFEWDESFTYKLQKSGAGILKLSFNKNADPDISGIQNVSNTNLLGLEVDAQSPLSISINIPDASKHRTLKAGKKLILDIYSPASGKSQQATNIQKSAKNKKQKDKVTFVQADPPSQKNLTQSTDKKNEHKSIKTASADGKANAASQKKHTPLQQARKLLDTNMITVSSTKSMGVSVFENHGDLWVAIDKDDIFVRPQAAGSNAEELKKSDKFDLEGGQAFRIKLPGKSRITADGAGLLWRIKLSPPDKDDLELKNTKPAMPKNITGAHAKVFWPIRGAIKILDITDPRTGETLKTISVREAKSFSGPPRRFVEFDTLPSHAGITIRPKVDDLQVKIVQGGIEITRPNGLHLLPQEHLATAIPHATPQREGEAKDKMIYHFEEWEMGGVQNLDENRSAILASLPDLSEGTRLEKLITLGKMHLANGLGAEALGFFNFAQAELPELIQNPGFLAMRGAAKSLNWKSEDGFNDLMASGLDEYDDVSYWKAYSLADLSDWTQAGQIMPDDVKPIKNYPSPVRNRLGLGLAEVALRAGNVEQAKNLLDMVESDMENLDLPQKSSLKYLKGEAARQSDDLKKTYQYWEELIEGDDDLYRAKAGLAHTRLKIDENKLEPEKAIDTLERLRYSWRGDELETQVNYWLGRTYFEGDSFLKGLRIMRDSASIAPTPEYARSIIEEMGAVFSNLYLGEKLKDVSALDAVALYEQFSELVPSGERGDQIIESLSHYLVKANLLTRAAKLLEHQIDHRLDDEEAVRVGTRLATIRLLDDNPKRALKTLDVVEQKLANLPDSYPKEAVGFDVLMLRIQALSEMDRPDEALAMLEPLDRIPEVNRLRADVAWNARYWDDAADALKDVIIDQKISLTRPLTDEQATLILNRAIALNLDGDRIAISNIREKYSVLMEQTTKNRIFEVITRARQNAQLADRETLLSTISEADLFKDFMDSYNKTLNIEE